MDIKTIKINVFEKDLNQKMKPFLISNKISPRSKNKFSAYFLFWFNSILLFPLTPHSKFDSFPIESFGICKRIREAQLGTDTYFFQLISTLLKLMSISPLRNFKKFICLR